MKKMSKTILGIIIGILIAFTIDVAAEAVISSGAVSYSNAVTSETTVSGALDELFSAVDINSKIGTTDISAIGDGTITGAIASQQTSIDNRTELQVAYDYTTNQLVAVNNYVTSIFGNASLKVVGTGTSPSNSMANYHLYGVMTTSTQVGKNVLLFSSKSGRAITYYMNHMQNLVGATPAVGYPLMTFIFTDTSTLSSYHGVVARYGATQMGFYSAEIIPAGTYIFSIFYSV